MIPVCSPTIKGNEKKYVNDCIDSTWIGSGGKYLKRFEEEFAKFCGVKYGSGCTSGTSALHLALLAARIKEGDEVLVPDFTMISTAAAVEYVGAKPVFVDAHAKTWNINPEKLADHITPKTKAIIVVHAFGVPCNMEMIRDIASVYNLIVIEDAAEAHGATFNGRPVGSLGDIACFSFYGNKLITTGEGGMVVTNNKDFIDRVNYLKNQAFSADRFKHQDIGYNYRMTNIQAAIGLAQLERIDDLIDDRERVYNYYKKHLSGVASFQHKISGSVVWMSAMLMDNKDEVMKHLANNGIQTRSLFYPMHMQPCLENTYRKNSVAYELFKHGLYLPSGGELTEEELAFIVEKVKEVAK